MSATQGRVLLAVSAQTRGRVLACLAGYEFAWARTEVEVRAALCTGHFDLAVVGSHFDESHTFDIVRELRHADPGLRIVCVRGRPFPGALGHSTMKAFRTACEAEGVCAVIDLLDYPEDDASNRAIRALFERQLLAASPPAA